jgi:hypothetical protein
MDNETKVAFAHASAHMIEVLDLAREVLITDDPEIPRKERLLEQMMSLEHRISVESERILKL